MKSWLVALSALVLSSSAYPMYLPLPIPTEPEEPLMMPPVIPQCTGMFPYQDGTQCPGSTCFGGICIPPEDCTIEDVRGPMDMACCGSVAGYSDAVWVHEYSCKGGGTCVIQERQTVANPSCTGCAPINVFPIVLPYGHSGPNPHYVIHPCN